MSHALEKELIRREIDIMNQLHHPKLINLHDAFEDDDEMVLIYELYVFLFYTTCFMIIVQRMVAKLLLNCSLLILAYREVNYLKE